MKSRKQAIAVAVLPFVAIGISGSADAKSSTSAMVELSKAVPASITVAGFPVVAPTLAGKNTVKCKTTKKETKKDPDKTKKQTKKSGTCV